ncbi:hypothetical protein B0H13DRAFT_1895164 [Mycena leptocephala]|nr:hypothetical protein B0H13DRAFT_1895164 [Mycena leptocephala]
MKKWRSSARDGHALEGLVWLAWESMNEERRPRTRSVGAGEGWIKNPDSVHTPTIPGIISTFIPVHADKGPSRPNKRVDRSVERDGNAGTIIESDILVFEPIATLIEFNVIANDQCDCASTSLCAKRWHAWQGEHFNVKSDSDSTSAHVFRFRLFDPEKNCVQRISDPEKNEFKGGDVVNAKEQSVAGIDRGKKTKLERRLTQNNPEPPAYVHPEQTTAPQTETLRDLPEKISGSPRSKHTVNAQ